MEDIIYIEDEGAPDYLDSLPDKCPVCNNAVIPKYVIMHKISDKLHEMLCKCPNGKCKSLFFASYKREYINPIGYTEVFNLYKLYPQSKTYKEFPQEINELSPKFVSIYNQAHHAEQERLDLICGGAYRKSLEFLVKDYIISEYPDDVETVKKIHSIQQCINKYIDNSDIKEMAERAVWLGNDETHYIKKWDNQDIDDLKNLIDLTGYFIAMKVKSKIYKEKMNK